MLNDISVEKRLNSRLNERIEKNNNRQLKIVSNLIDFASNDYLGLARSQFLADAYKEELHQLAQSIPIMGSTGSRLLTGNSLYLEELEVSLARFHKAESGLIFNNGYMANFGLLSTLPAPDDTVIYDLQVHASMREGIKRSRAYALPFFHQNLNHLEERLKKVKKNVFVCVESLYSLDGRITPLTQISELCQKYNAKLIVDEAHATGILGEKGEGLVCALNLEDRIFARIHTFGKACGVLGAIIFGSQLLKSYLINFCLSFIYTTALPPASLAAIKCSYNAVKGAQKERNQLKKLQNHFASLIANFGKKALNPIDSPIIPIYAKGNQKVKNLSSELQDQGFDIRPILSPTVKKGRECLRLCLHAFNTVEEINSLFLALKHHFEES